MKHVIAITLSLYVAWGNAGVISSSRSRTSSIASAAPAAALLHQFQDSAQLPLQFCLGWVPGACSCQGRHFFMHLIQINLGDLQEEFVLVLFPVVFYNSVLTTYSPFMSLVSWWNHQNGTHKLTLEKSATHVDHPKPIGQSTNMRRLGRTSVESTLHLLSLSSIPASIHLPYPNPLKKPYPDPLKNARKACSTPSTPSTEIDPFCPSIPLFLFQALCSGSSAPVLKLVSGNVRAFIQVVRRRPPCLENVVAGIDGLWEEDGRHSERFRSCAFMGCSVDMGIVGLMVELHVRNWQGRFEDLIIHPSS